MPMGAKVANIVEWVLNILLGVAVVLFLVMPMLGYKPYVVLSGSMEPVVHTGSVAYINTHETVPAEGEIAAYTLENGEVVTHRVKSANGSSYTFKGDANDVADLNVVDGSQIVGTYMFSIPGLGYTLSKIQDNRLILIPISCAIGVILLLCEITGKSAESGQTRSGT